MDEQILSQLPGMTSLTERRYFRDYTAWCYTGEGQVVDLGCWLGSTTIPLAMGLKENSRPQAQGRQVQAYDLFVWEEWMEGIVKGTPLEGRFQPGDSFRAEFQRHSAPWLDRIEVREVDLARQTWSGGPIEFLLIDAMKSWELCNSIACRFFPALVPGLSLVVHQDFSHYYTSWIHLQMYRLRGYFEPVADLPGSCSLVFRLGQAIPDSLLQQELSFADFSDSEIDEAFAWSRSLVVPSKHPAIEAARLMSFVHAGRLDLARSQLRRYLATGGPVNYDIDCVRSTIMPRAASPVRLGPLASLYRLWRGRFGKLKRWLVRS